MYFQPAHFPFGPKKDVFYRGQFVIWPRVLIIMRVYRKSSVNYFGLRTISKTESRSEGVFT